MFPVDAGIEGRKVRERRCVCVCVCAHVCVHAMCVSMYVFMCVHDG